MRDRNGDHVTAHDVLADHELETHYRGRPWPRYTGYEHLAIGGDPEQIAYELLAGCPRCGDDITPDDLCEHDDPTTGPLCIHRCCPIEHRTYKPWKPAA